MALSWAMSFNFAKFLSVVSLLATFRACLSNNVPVTARGPNNSSLLISLSSDTSSLSRRRRRRLALRSVSTLENLVDWGTPIPLLGFPVWG